MSVEPEFSSNVFLEIRIAAPATNTTAIPAQYSQQLVSPFLDRADDFKYTVVRFSIPINCIPYFTAPANTYQIALSWRGVNYPEFVSLVSYSVSAPNDVYFIQQFIDSLNDALVASYNAVVAANPGDAMLLAGHAPYFEYDATTQLISLVTDQGVWSTNSSYAGTNPAVYINTALSNLLSEMPQKFLAYNSVSGIDDQIMVVERAANLHAANGVSCCSCDYYTAAQSGATGNSAVTSIPVSATPYALPIGSNLIWQLSPTGGGAPLLQQFSLSANVASGATNLATNSFILSADARPGEALCYVAPLLVYTTDETPSVVSWISAFSVVIQTKLAPMRPQAIPSANLLGGVQQDLTSQPILADFLYPETERLSGTSSLVYIPTTELRWIDMLAETSYNTIDRSFYWSDHAGNLTQIMLPPGSLAAITELYRRKERHGTVPMPISGKRPRDDPFYRQRKRLTRSWET